MKLLAIRLSPQAGKSLVIAVLTPHCHRRSLCVAVDAKHRVPHGIPLAGTVALFRLRIETGIWYG